MAETSQLVEFPSPPVNIIEERVSELTSEESRLSVESEISLKSEKQQIKNKLKTHLRGALGLNIPNVESNDFEESERKAGGFKTRKIEESRIFGVLGAAIGKQVK